MLQLNQNITECGFTNAIREMDYLNRHRYLINLFQHKTIINVYQDNYIEYNYDSITKTTQPCTGLSDFIRGCYFLMQFVQNTNISFNFVINSPIKYFLYNEGNTRILNYIDQKKLINKILYTANINNFYNNELNDQYKIVSFKHNWYHIGIMFNYLLWYLNKNKQTDILYVYIISFPDMNISQKHKKIMRNFLKPNHKLKEKINKTLELLEFCKYSYIAIHIRLDDHFVNNQYNTNSDQLEFIINKLGELYKSDTNYIIISNNNIIKQIIHNKYPKMKFIIHDIIHVADATHESDLTSLENTMIDFYIMSYSMAITSFSVYLHGTGFSNWCAITYNIPYECYYIGHL